ncbi:MAG: glycosyltransferase family 4 protein [Cyclobacteriaceae bacterium]|nr:glycosyltransferase family 4 protein [Cyclobacteriaceae bacterium]
MAEGIIWLTENYPPQRGGMAQSCDRIIRGLRNRGFYIHIIHFTNREKPFVTEEQINGTYTAIPFEDSESHILHRTWLTVKKFAGIKMVVCFGGYLSMIGAPVFARWLNVTLVTMVRGNDFDVSIFSPRKRKILEDAFSASSLVASVCEEKTEKIIKTFPGTNAVTIPNGLDAVEWKASESEKKFAEKWRRERGINNSDKICIGLFGQLKAKKGGEFLLRSLENFPIIKKIHFLLVGEISEVAEALLEEGFSYDRLPFLDRYELIKYYLCCDAVAIPSFYDGMPNVLLESGGLGIPVIASDVDGMKDAIVHQQAGLLFEAGNSEACRKTIYDFVALPVEDRRQLGSDLKETIISIYSVKNETDSYEQIFNNVLGDQPDHPIVQWGGR